MENEDFNKRIIVWLIMWGILQGLTGPHYLSFYTKIIMSRLTGFPICFVLAQLGFLARWITSSGSWDLDFYQQIPQRRIHSAHAVCTSLNEVKSSIRIILFWLKHYLNHARLFVKKKDRKYGAPEYKIVRSKLQNISRLI